VEKPPESPPDIAIDSSSETHEEAGAEGHIETPHVKLKKAAVTAEMKADPISRKMILLSLFFAGLATLCFAVMAYVHHQKKIAKPTAVTETTNKPLDPVITQEIEEIHVILKNEQELRVEMVVECGQIETCNYIKDHLAESRDLLIPILNTINPNELSKVDYKNLIKKKLADHLNTMEMVGKVIQVEFTNLVVEGDPK